MGKGRSVFKMTPCLSGMGYFLTINQARFLPASALSIGRYAPFPTTRRAASHAHTKYQDTTAYLNDSGPIQAYPLSGYYHDILSSRSPYRRQASSSRPISKELDDESSTSSIEPHSPQDKMSIVFGTRLAGPGRSSRYNPGSRPPGSTWKTINGVAIPPRPEEPDNCCMSGCVHCVWDDFRDEMEDWAARVAQAKAKGASKGPTGDLLHTPRAEVASASTSMDDDGGGSEANWTIPDQADDLFASIPVGIREFMKTEKKLKQKHQHHGEAS
ncbi:oxidoreductase-like protein [Aspergillus pseudonomiae]|uniref:Oxidoreductase-like protein n=1 Tax=Aspergillus pseudonomiae TaxID=1506151 RepID=A0A5N6HYS5_9EURO|nr:oxidoreductase-like protein [Aspergillus pseudonomiae]KAB8258887.1 oxidoreductase-like protein [Aspergillus pseudonomiae]KAE8403576.1 oxidoreductase-like protein [Aspergillus pseudonomiae]